MVPEISVVSSVVVQKQVGQTFVQLPQVRQRSATSSQRGWFGLACSNSLSPFVSRVRPIPGSGDDPISGCDFHPGCKPIRQIPDQVRSCSAAQLHHKQMMALLNEFCQREVETRLDLGSGIHRDAKTDTARLTAIDRNNKGTIAPNSVGLVVDDLSASQPDAGGIAARVAKRKTAEGHHRKPVDLADHFAVGLDADGLAADLLLQSAINPVTAPELRIDRLLHLCCRDRGLAGTDRQMVGLLQKIDDFAQPGG